MSISIGPDIVIGRRMGVRLSGGGGDWYAGGGSLASSLVAYWRLDETSGNRADSVGSYTLTDNNTVTSNVGVVYPLMAEFVVANGEYLSVASDAGIRSGNFNWWCAAWVRLASVGSGTRIIMSNWRPSSRGFLLANVDATVQFQLGNGGGGGGAALTIASGLSVDTDYFVIAWYDAAAARIYGSINGAAAANVLSGITPGASTAPVQISGNDDGTANFFGGRIGPAMIGHNYMPTVDDIAYLYNSGAGRK